MSRDNGSTSPDPTDRIVAELREAIAAERVSRIEHERAVVESREREKRLTRAVKALESGKPGRKPPSPAGRGKPTDDVVTRALVALTEAVEPLSSRELGEAMGVSTEWARKAAERLREQGRARHAGVRQVGRQSAHTYAAMPGGDDA